jgi:alpha-ketoglutaric semialdehyde dehydrogenase
MQLSGENFIGSQRSAKGSQTFQGMDPAKGAALEPVIHEATAEEIDAAVEAAEGAFDEYHRRLSSERAAFLRAIAAEIEALGDELIEHAMAETALPAARLIGERGRTTGQLRMFANLLDEGSWVGASIDRADPNRKPLPKPDLRRMLIPIGPVAVFEASNFPLAYSTAGGDTASALAAGCTVVVKAHPSHPGTSELVMAAIQKAIAATKMPAGVVSMLHGRSPEMALEVVRHPLIKAVGFTGSLRAGRAIYNAAAARPEPIPVYAEMGSVNPVFILPRAMKERGAQIAEGLKNSVTMGVGQFCTNPGVVVTLEAQPAFGDQLGALISGAPVGTMLNEGMGRAFTEGVKKLTVAKGVRVAGQCNAGGALPTHAAAVVFTTSAERFAGDPALQEEVFGPSTVVVNGTTPAELRKVAESMEGQLTATIHAAAGELVEYQWLVDLLQRKVGRLLLNGYPTGVEVCASMVHGGPYPATTDARTTSVGSAAIERFVRPVCFQDFEQAALPIELRDGNPRGIWRMVLGQITKD